METLFTIYLFVLGAIFGSFILVVVDRTKAGKNWIRGRSQCESCKHTLSAFDLIPIVSWIVSKGRCRYCHKNLSSSYPLTEFILGVSFVISYLFWPYDFSQPVSVTLLVIWLISLVLLCGLFIYDLRWFLLPNKLVNPLIIMSLIWVVVLFLNSDIDSPSILDYSLSLLVSSGFFYILSVISKGKWIGGGDISLGIAIGLFTGSWLQSWLVIFIASILGIISVLPSIIHNRTSRKKVLKMKIPFGPLLIIGLYVVVLFGSKITDWYVSDILLL